MTLGRTGINRGAGRTFHGSFLRDRTDGGGGKADDDSDDTGDDSDDGGMDDEDDDDDADEGDEKEDDKPKVPTRRDGKPATQEDFDRLQEALRKERRKNRRSAAKEGEEGTDELKATAEKWTGVVKTTAARSALAEAGLVLPEDSEGRTRTIKRALKLLDLGDVEVDPDTGDVDGLDDAIADLRDDMPELFRKKGNGKIDGADKDGKRGGKRDLSKMSSTEIQALQLRGEL